MSEHMVSHFFKGFELQKENSEQNLRCEEKREKKSALLVPQRFFGLLVVLFSENRPLEKNLV